MINLKELVFRDATLDDVDTLTELSHKTVLIKYPPIIGKEAVEGYVQSGAVPQYYRDRLKYCRVVSLEGTPVGACGLRDNSVDLMMVTLDHHRKGIGTLLLKDAETLLFEKHSSLFLNSFRDNSQANQFYLKHGWRLEKEFDDPDYGIPMVRLSKKQ